MIAVLAGNRYEFKRWCEDHAGDEKNSRYINGLKDFAGHVFESYEIIGTFWAREDSSYLWFEVRIRIRETSYGT